jgi:hypothetical protein
MSLPDVFKFWTAKPLFISQYFRSLHTSCDREGTTEGQCQGAAHAASPVVQLGTWVAQGFFSMYRGISNWPFTEKARAHVASQDPLQTSHIRCIPVTAPMLMLYPVTNQIEVDGDVVRMRIDWMESERVIYMDGRSHPQNGARLLHGHSIGRWDGKTLVIDTAQFADHTDGNFMTVPSGAGKQLVERLALTEDGRHLKYDVELRDPEWFTAPVIHSALFDYHPELAPSGLPTQLRTR